MRIYKAFQRSFTPMDNELLRCREISVFAKTIYLFIDSHCDAWEFSVERIAWALNISIDRARAGIRELENIGLLERERLNNVEGRKGWQVKYYLHDKESSPKSAYLKSLFEKSAREFSMGQKSIMENPASNIIIYTEKNIKEKNIDKNTNAHASDALAAPAKASGLECEPNQPKPKSPKQAEPTDEQLAAFEIFWEKYPKRNKKQPALVAFLKALSGKAARGRFMPKGVAVTPELIMQGLEQWIAQWKREGKEKGSPYIPDASTWLNDMCYLDSLEASPTNGREAIAQFNQQNGLKGDSAVKGYYNLPRHLQEDIEGNWRDFMPKTEEERKANELAVKRALGLEDEE